MSLQTRIESLVVRIAQEFNAVNTKTGALANLTTADKSNLVAAINELKTMVANGIDDASITLTSVNRRAILTTFRRPILTRA